MAEGRYIALEGSEGSGKSTHARRLARELDAVLTREHGGTEIGLLIRSILADPAHVALTAKAEALLIAADRAQHLDELVVPALAAGRHVVTDRSLYSSLTYQGYGRGLPLDQVRAVNEWAVGGRWPDLVVLLEVPADQLTRRLGRRELDRFEREDAAFYERVVDGYRALAAAEPDRWVVVDGRGPMDDVALVIRAAVREHLGI